MPTKKKKNNTFAKKIFAILLFLGAIYLSSDVLKRFYNIFTLQKKAELVEEQLEILKDENATLISTKEKLEDPDYVQTYARGKYMFSKGDEKVFYLPGADE